ncbi:MAG: hypothetical protein M3466_10400 [Gemmatimonadota bacterium]|nr:hypothetical protein [Gemmatimonadota bacterium]
MADGPRQPQVEALADQALSQVAELDGKAQAGGKRRVAQEVALQWARRQVPLVAGENDKVVVQPGAKGVRAGRTTPSRRPASRGALLQKAPGVENLRVAELGGQRPALQADRGAVPALLTRLIEVRALRLAVAASAVAEGKAGALLAVVGRRSRVPVEKNHPV